MSKSNSALVIAFIAVFLIGSAFGQHMNEKDSPCASVVITSNLTTCLSDAQKTADGEMNLLYSDIRRRVNSRRDDLQRLVDAQRAWLKYRDASCAAERDLYNGGTARWPAFYGCIEALTRQRTH